MSEQYELNKNLAQMLKGGVIMDVTTPEQARIAEEAGACAVMALERIPADDPRGRWCFPHERSEDDQGIRGGCIHSGYGKCRIGHFVEAQILEAIEIDYIDESEVLSPGGRCVPYRQAQIQRSICLRCEGPGGGAPPH